MYATRQTLAALCAAAISTAPFAQDALPRDGITEWTTWDCWLERATRIMCRLEAAAPTQGLPEPTPLASPTAFTPSGRPIVKTELSRTILNQPDRLRERTISIPLYSPPDSRSDAEELASAVMCANRADCRVAFRSPHDPAQD